MTEQRSIHGKKEEEKEKQQTREKAVKCYYAKYIRDIFVIRTPSP